MNFESPFVIATVGGEGTRLFPLTLNITKAIIELCNRATLARALEPLIYQGCREIVIASKGYDNAAQLNKYFKEGVGFFKELGVETKEEIRYQPNYPDKGSGDAVRYCMEYYDIKKDVLVIGGDNIMEVDLKSIMEFHSRNNALLTIGLKEIEGDVSQFGVAEVEDGRVKRFVEKPKPGKEPSKLINAGLYLFSPKIREVFKEMGDRVRDIGRDVIPYLVEKGYPVYSYMLRGYWADVGTPGNFLKTCIDILHGKVSQVVLSHKYNERQWIHPSTAYRNNHFKDMRIGDYTMIGRHCTFGRGVEIENSSIGHSCIIGEDTKIKNSVVLSFARIGKGVRLNKCILGRFTTVEDNAVIDADLNVEVVGNPFEKISVIGGGGVTIFKNSVIGPGKRVAPIQNSHRILTTGRFVELGMDRENIYFAEKM